MLCAGLLWGATVNVVRAGAAEPTQLQSTVTSATLSSGNFSTWLSRPTTVTLVAPSWATATKYHFGTAAETSYVQPIGLRTEGKTTLYFQSSSAESIEPLQTLEVWLDFTAPTQPGDMIFSQPEFDGFSYSFGPAKDTLSGISSYEITVPSEAGSSTFATQTVTGTAGRISHLTPGTYEISYAAKDFAGNMSSPQTRTVMVGLAKPTLTYQIADPEMAERIAQGAWITTGVDVRLNASLTSEAPTSTLKMQTISGSLETTDVARNNYSAIPLTITEQGMGKVSLSATDLYGNNSDETSFTLKVDRIAPSDPSLVVAHVKKAISDASQLNMNLSWEPSYDAASGVDYYRVTAQRKGDGFAGASTITTDDPRAVLTNVQKGEYVITVRAFDKAGLSSNIVQIEKSVSDTADVVAPTKSPTSGTTHSTPPSQDSSKASSTSSDTSKDGSSSNSVGSEAEIDEVAATDNDSATIAGNEEGAVPSEMARALSGAASLAKSPDSVWEKILDFLRNEWLIWVPALLALIAAIVLTVALVRRKKSPDAADALEQTREFESLDDQDRFLNVGGVEETKETAQPSSEPLSQLSDQAGQYFTINS